MNDCQSAEERLAQHRAKLQSAGAMPMTAEEILSGQSQAGVPRPAFLKGDDDDGSIEFVGTGKGL